MRPDFRCLRRSGACGAIPSSYCAPLLGAVVVTCGYGPEWCSDLHEHRTIGIRLGRSHSDRFGGLVQCGLHQNCTSATTISRYSIDGGTMRRLAISAVLILCACGSSSSPATTTTTPSLDTTHVQVSQKCADALSALAHVSEDADNSVLDSVAAVSLTECKSGSEWVKGAVLWIANPPDPNIIAPGTSGEKVLAAYCSGNESLPACRP